MNAEEYRMINDLNFGSAYINSMDIEQITLTNDEVIINRKKYMNCYKLDKYGIKRAALIIDLLKNVRPNIKVNDLRENRSDD